MICSTCWQPNCTGRPCLPNGSLRPHLIQRLNEGLEVGRQITLVSAPAGFGKTLCVSEWVDALELPVTWLSLDPSDDDPGRFFTYLIAALQKVDENIGGEIQGILRAGQLPPGEIISATLINAIQPWETCSCWCWMISRSSRMSSSCRSWRT